MLARPAQPERPGRQASRRGAGLERRRYRLTNAAQAGRIHRVKVIGAGFHRTGTLSLKAALERLGYGPCYHMAELRRHLEHTDSWLAAADGDAGALQEVLQDFAAAVDWPTCHFWRELADLHPDAKIILTVRDPDQWFDSHCGLMRSVLRMRAAASAGGPTAAIGPVIKRLMIEDTFDGRIANRTHCIAVFQRHAEQVRASLPPERLLTFNVAEGWAPLCSFLDVPVPDAEFPHLNRGQPALDGAGLE